MSRESIASDAVQKMADGIAKEIRSFQNGEQEAFSRLYELSKNYVYYTILKNRIPESAAEDIMQEVYLAIYNGAASIQEPQAAMAWIRQVAFHKAMNYFRENKRERPVSGNGTTGNASDQENPTTGNLENVGFENLDQEIEDTRFPVPEALMDDRETQRLLRQTIEELSEDQRKVILAFYYNGCTVSEIAELFEVPEGTVKTNLYRARGKIRTSIENMERTQGIRLHTAALAPALLFLFHTEAQAAEVPAAVSVAVSKTITNVTARATAAAAASMAPQRPQQSPISMEPQQPQQSMASMAPQQPQQSMASMAPQQPQQSMASMAPQQPAQNAMQQWGAGGQMTLPQQMARTAGRKGAFFVGKKLVAGIAAAALVGGAGAGYYVLIRSTPEKTIQQFEDAYNEKDIEAMMECMDGQSRQAYQSVKTLTQLLGVEPQEILDGVLGWGEYLEVVDSDDLLVNIEVQNVDYVSSGFAVAEVVITMGEEQSEDSMELIKEDGNWYLYSETEDFGM